MVDSALYNARTVPRDKALKKSKGKKKQRPIFFLPYDPRLPAITSSIEKHWRSMTNQGSYMKQVFPVPPLIAFKKRAILKAVS